MKPCSRCDRHVRLAESVCPFCGAHLTEGTATSVRGWAVGLALLGAACGPGKGESSSDGTSTTSTTSTTSSTSDGATVTSAPTTSGGTMGGTGTSTGGDETSTTECVSCSSSSEGGAFIYAAPDMGVEIGCDPWVQDCPEGQKCVPTASGEQWDALECVPVADVPGQTGEPCTALGHPTSGLDTCAKGLICFEVDPQTLAGVCVAQCVGTPDAPACEPVDTTCTEVAPTLASLCL